MRWPDVVLGGSHTPYVDRVLDEEPYITSPKEVVAYGIVDGYPWSLVFFEKENDPEDDEPELAPGYVPPSLRFEFFLGGSPGLPGAQPGGLGGGGGPISIRDGAHLETTANSWESRPPVIGYVVFTSDDVAELEVVPEGLEPRRIDTARLREGFPSVCIFFPPFGASGVVIARDETGVELERQNLFARPGSGSILAGGR